MWDMDLINIQEQMGAIFLSNANEVLGFRLIATGNLKSCPTNIKLISAVALKTMCQSVILIHNHPSGKLTPSFNDKKVTKNTKEALKLIDCELLYHLIINVNSFISMAQDMPKKDVRYFFS